MDRIYYTEEIKALIDEFFKYRNKHWKIIQFFYVLSNILFLFVIAAAEGNIPFAPLLISQGVTLWLIIRNHNMKKRYQAGLFLKEKAEYYSFVNFVVDKKNMDPSYLHSKFEKMIAESKKKN